MYVKPVVDKRICFTRCRQLVFFSYPGLGGGYSFVFDDIILVDIRFHHILVCQCIRLVHDWDLSLFLFGFGFFLF